MIEAQAHRALRAHLGPRRRVWCWRSFGAKDVNHALAALQFRAPRASPATSPKCCGRRLPMRSRRPDSAAMSIGCSCRRASRIRVRRRKRVRPAAGWGRGLPGCLKRTAHLTVARVRATRGKWCRWADRGPGGAPRRPRGGSEKKNRRRRRAPQKAKEVTGGPEGSPVWVPARVSTRRGGSRWYSDRDYAKLLHEDLALRANLKKKRFAPRPASRRSRPSAPANKLKIDIYTSRPGIIIGRKGTEVDKLKQEIQKRTSREGLHQHPGDPEAGAGTRN